MAEKSYARAMARLQEIIADIEREEIDVDELGRRVKEAAGLVRTCRDKIRKADLEVRNVVDELSRLDSEQG
ncbi:MAG: exodeoxyribonuclease VII small subunit [Candidatus Omnitrophota bacterium]